MLVETVLEYPQLFRPSDQIFLAYDPEGMNTALLVLGALLAIPDQLQLERVRMQTVWLILAMPNYTNTRIWGDLLQVEILLPRFLQTLGVNQLYWRCTDHCLYHLLRWARTIPLVCSMPTLSTVCEFMWGRYNWWLIAQVMLRLTAADSVDRISLSCNWVDNWLGKHTKPPSKSAASSASALVFLNKHDPPAQPERGTATLTSIPITYYHVFLYVLVAMHFIFPQIL